MPQDIVGDEDGDSCGFNQGGKDCYMPRDSVGAEDGDSCGYNQGGKDCNKPQDIVAMRTLTAAAITKAVRTATCLRTS